MTSDSTPKQKPLYRVANIDDLLALCVLGQEVNQVHHDAWPRIFAPRSDPRRDEAHWLQCIGTSNGQTSDAATFVAEDAGAVVGFVAIHIVDERNSLLQPIRYVRVGTVCVAEASRGRGIGRELMALAERWAIEHEAVDVRLNVWAFNQAALRLYEELGYELRSLFMGKALPRNRGSSVEPESKS